MDSGISSNIQQLSQYINDISYMCQETCEGDSPEDEFLDQQFDDMLSLLPSDLDMSKITPELFDKIIELSKAEISHDS